MADVVAALRSMRRTPTLTAVFIVTLALGLGANTALFTIARQVLTKTLPVDDAEYLIELGCTNPEGSCTTSYPGVQEYLRSPGPLSSIFAFSTTLTDVALTARGRTEIVSTLFLSGDSFGLLGLSAHTGRLLRADDEGKGAGHVLVLSYTSWQELYGGDSTVVGTDVLLRGSTFTIVGVLPREFRGFTFGSTPDIAVPLRAAETLRSPAMLRGVEWLSVIARRPASIPTHAIQAAMAPVFTRAKEAAAVSAPAPAARAIRTAAASSRLVVQPAALGASSEFRASLVPTIRNLTVVVVALLLLAWSNLADLLLARAVARRKEYAVRLALGCGRARLIRDVLTESALLCGFGAIAGVIGAKWLTPFLLRLGAGDIGLRALDVQIDAPVFVFLAVISALTAMSVGAAAVFFASAVNPQGALSGRFTSRREKRLSRILVTAQVAVSLVLLLMAGAFVQTLQGLRNSDVGFDSAHLAAVTVAPALVGRTVPQTLDFARRAHDRLAGIPGVQSVAFAAVMPTRGVVETRAIEDPNVASRLVEGVGVNAVSAGLVATLRMRLLAGRDLADSDVAGSENVAVVNRTFVQRVLGRDEAVGMSFKVAEAAPYRVVGVVDDIRDFGVKSPVRPMMYVPFLRQPGRSVTFLVRSETSMSSLASAVRAAIRDVDSGMPVRRLESVESTVDESLSRERLLATLGSLFGITALLLVAVGLYGMLNRFVADHATELALRMALGATASASAWLVMRTGLYVVIAGMSIGALLSAGAAGWVQTHIYGASITNLPLLLSVVGLLLAVASLAIWVSVRRVLTMQPNVVLREI